jgi:pimeloyl-ACP methyl ester carboxylesterase
LKRRSSFRKAARLAGVVAGACLLFLMALSLWNLAVTRWQHARIPVPGNFYSVDGRQMHLYCSGAGAPTVGIEAGLGSDWLGWQVVQPRLSALTRVCTYDRSGLGWSEPRSGPRDAEAIARQLHALLDNAGVRRPLVLTGHSAGGFYVREYAREFPAEVAGVVLVDSTSPRQIDELPGFRASYEADKRGATRELWSDRLRVWSGWERLMGHCRDTPGKGLAALADLYNAKTCRPEYVDGDLGEYIDFENAANQEARLTSFGNKPLLILSKDPNSRKNGISPNALAELPIWDREQEGLKSLSRSCWRVIARDSGHKIFQDRPEVVQAEISRLIEFLRGGPAPPFGTIGSLQKASPEHPSTTFEPPPVTAVNLYQLRSQP